MFKENHPVDVCVRLYSSRTMASNIFRRELVSLSQSDEYIFENFMRGFFTIRRSKREFSNMDINQTHDQNNKLMKIDGGAIGMFNESSLLKSSVA